MHNNIKQAHFLFGADFFPARASEKQIRMNTMAPHSSALTLYTFSPSYPRHALTHADVDKVAIMVLIPATI